MRNSLIWIEPNGGWTSNKDEDGIEYNDTGLCNRVLHWEIAYKINEKAGFNYNIVVEEEFWPEYDLITLPNTLALNQESISTESIPLSFEKATSILRSDDFNLDLTKNYRSDFGYKTLVSFYDELYFFHPLAHIELKSSFIKDYLKKVTKDVVGIHIRRNSGVSYKEEDLSYLTPGLKEEYIKFRSNSAQVKGLSYIKDEVYFNVIDNILKINPSQKFYLSCDLPYELFSYYKDRYGFSIITKEDIMPEILKVEKESKTLNNLVDLFALSYCKFLIKSNNSSWSDFAQFYKNQPATYVKDHFERVIKPKYMNSSWDQEGHYGLEKIKVKRNLF